MKWHFKSKTQQVVVERMTRLVNGLSRFGLKADQEVWAKDFPFILSTAKSVLAGYEKELESKHDIITSVAGVEEKDTGMYLMTSWIHEPNIVVSEIDPIDQAVIVQMR